jgi:two-component system CheB/CheR fusion protein
MANPEPGDQLDILKRAVDSCLNGIAISDARGFLTYVNPAFLRIWRLDREEEALGRHYSSFWPESEQGKVSGLVKEFHEKGWARAEMAAKLKGGGCALLDVSGSLVRGSDGRAACMMGSFVEITYRRSLEDSLRQAKEEAEKANRIKSEFLASVSHEIRTPLNSVIGFTDLLLDRESDLKSRSYLERIKSSGEALMGIIDNILDFSKLEAGKAELEFADFNLKSAVESVMALLPSAACGKGLRLESEIRPEVPWLLHGDVRRLTQVLNNLLGNAVKFAESGSVRLTVSLDSETDAHAVLRFAVEDDGPGIPASKMDRLFKPFSQIKPRGKFQVKGTGLGLAISKNLVNLMGGRIGVESEEGRGSSFWFTCAFGKKPREKYKPVLRSPAREGGASRLRVLSVEDDRSNQELIEAFLDSMEVSTAGNGREALEILKAERFDLVLMDIEMPEIDGLSAIRLIRDPASRVLDPRVPIVAVTAHAMAGDRERFLRAGADAYVSKPIDGRKLLKVIEQAASRPPGP